MVPNDSREGKPNCVLSEGEIGFKRRVGSSYDAIKKMGMGIFE